MESTTERIKMIMKYYSLDEKTFADKVRIMPTTLDHILKGHKNPTLDIFKKIAFAFPEINIDWIVVGKGDMNVNDHVSKAIEELFSKENNVRRIKVMLTNMLENPDI